MRAWCLAAWHGPGGWWQPWGVRYCKVRHLLACPACRRSRPTCWWTTRGASRWQASQGGGAQAVPVGCPAVPPRRAGSISSQRPLAHTLGKCTPPPPADFNLSKLVEGTDSSNAKTGTMAGANPKWLVSAGRGLPVFKPAGKCRCCACMLRHRLVTQPRSEFACAPSLALALIGHQWLLLPWLRTAGARGDWRAVGHGARRRVVLWRGAVGGKPAVLHNHSKCCCLTGVATNCVSNL